MKKLLTIACIVLVALCVTVTGYAAVGRFGDIDANRASANTAKDVIVMGWFYSPSETGTIETITAKINTAQSTGEVEFRFAIYDTDTALLGQTDEATADMSVQFYELPLESEYTFAADTRYGLAVWFDGTGGASTAGNYYGEATAGDSITSLSIDYSTRGGNYPSTLADSGWTTTHITLAIFVTYRDDDEAFFWGTMPNGEDAVLFGSIFDVNANYGRQTGNVTVSDFTPNNHLFRWANLANYLPASKVITSCSLFIYVALGPTPDSGDCDLWRVFKPWVEGEAQGSGTGTGATWNDWSRTALEWGTAGCANADDGGSDNSSDGADADRTATADGNLVVDASGTGYWGVDLDTSLANAWYNSTKNEEGVLMEPATSETFSINHSEHPHSGQLPYWKLTFSDPPAAGGAVSPRRRKLLLLEGGS